MKKLFLKLLLLFVVLAGSGQPLLSMDGAGPSRKRRRTMAAPLRLLGEIQPDLANPQVAGAELAEDELEGEGEVAEREYGSVNPYSYDKNKSCFVDMFKRPVRLSGEGELTECPEISMSSDVVLKILGYLSQKDRINTNLVCRSFDRNVRRFYQGNSNSREPLAIDRSKFTQECIDWFSKHCFSRLKLLRGTKKDSFQLEQFEHLSIAGLTGLKSLSVDFCYCQISDGGLEAFARWLGGLTGLKSLSVDFYCCRKISDAGLKAFAWWLGGLTGLKSLSVNFNWCQISDGGLEAFAGCLGGLTGLQSLSVDFRACDGIGDTGLQALGRSLGGLGGLRSLSVCFSGCRISDGGLEAFGRSLGGLGGLRSLSVCFSGCRISDGGLEAFARWLGGLTGLQSLSVDFSWYREISDAGLQAFSRALGGLTGLQSLSVNFVACGEIGDGGLKAFARWLGGLTGLKSLSVDFVACGEISDAGLKAFARWLGGLTRLKSLWVDFRESEIGDAGFEIFCRLLDEQGFKPIGTTANWPPCSWMRP